MNNASLGDVVPEPEVLIPEVMAPEEEMPRATPVNASMPEFLDSLRTLLSTYDDQVISPDLPPEAVQDFAHGTNELLNYLLHEVVGAAAPVVEQHAPEAVLDFAEPTNELLNYLLSQVAEPEVREDVVFSPEAMADFQAGTQDLLHQLLTMADQEEAGGCQTQGASVIEPPWQPQPEASFATPVEAPVEPQIEWTSDAVGDLLGDLLAKPSEEPLGAPEPPADSFDEEATHGLLSGLLANLTGENTPETFLSPASGTHNLGEVPREYIDESDDEDVERPAGPFEMLLDAIDAELPTPPAIRGIVQTAADAPTPGDRFIAFEVGTESYALPFSCVLETDRVPRWTYVPGVAAHLRGVVNLRGEIISLVDLRTLFGFGVAATEGRMVVIRGSLSKTAVAFVVDRLLGLASLPAAEITPPPGTGVVRGLASASGRKVGLIDPGRLIAAANGDHVLPRHTILTNYLEEQSYV